MEEPTDGVGHLYNAGGKGEKSLDQCAVDVMGGIIFAFKGKTSIQGNMMIHRKEGR